MAESEDKTKPDLGYLPGGQHIYAVRSRRPRHAPPATEPPPTHPHPPLISPHTDMPQNLSYTVLQLDLGLDGKTLVASS